MKDRLNYYTQYYTDSSLLHLTNPDVAETDGLAGVAVHLQTDRAVAVLYNPRVADVFGCTTNCVVVNQQNAILNNCYRRSYAV